MAKDRSGEITAKNAKAAKTEQEFTTKTPSHQEEGRVETVKVVKDAKTGPGLIPRRRDFQVPILT